MKTKNELSPADKKWGFVYGVDGYVDRQESANLLGVTVRTIDVYGALRKIRKGKNAVGAVAFCRRSVGIRGRLRWLADQTGGRGAA